MEQEKLTSRGAGGVSALRLVGVARGRQLSRIS